MPPPYACCRNYSQFIVCGTMPLTINILHRVIISECHCFAWWTWWSAAASIHTRHPLKHTALTNNHHTAAVHIYIYKYMGWWCRVDASSPHTSHITHHPCFRLFSIYYYYYYSLLNVIKFVISRWRCCLLVARSIVGCVTEATLWTRARAQVPSVVVNGWWCICVLPLFYYHW